MKKKTYTHPSCDIYRVAPLRLCDGSLPMTDDRVDHFDVRTERWEDCQSQQEDWDW